MNGAAAAESRWSSLQKFLRALDVDLTPSAFKSYGPYTVLRSVRVGDHVAVRSVTNGQKDVAWHHGIYVGGDSDNLVHMHPDGNISKVPFDRFMGNVISDGCCIDAAGIVEYRDDNDAHRLRAAFIAELATQDPTMQSLVYNGVSRTCCCFATWCRSGRCDATPLILQVLRQVSPTVPIHHSK
jgi:hypothetical protein